MGLLVRESLHTIEPEISHNCPPAQNHDFDQMVSQNADFTGGGDGGRKVGLGGYNPMKVS